VPATVRIFAVHALFQLRKSSLTQPPQSVIPSEAQHYRWCDQIFSAKTQRRRVFFEKRNGLFDDADGEDEAS